MIMTRPICMTNHTETTVTLVAKCPCCGVAHNININIKPTDFASCVADWYKGNYIQYAFSTLSVDEREFILTNVCTECNKMMMGEY